MAWPSDGDDAGKWTRAHAIVAEEEALQEQCELITSANKRSLGRFRSAGATEVLRMF